MRAIADGPLWTESLRKEYELYVVKLSKHVKWDLWERKLKQAAKREISSHNGILMPGYWGTEG